MTYEEFIKNMLGNYANFTAFTEGAAFNAHSLATKQDGVITNQTGGLFLFLRPHQDITEIVGQVSREISEMLGVDNMMMYGEGIAHATVFVAKQGPNYDAKKDKEFSSLKGKLSLVCQKMVTGTKMKKCPAADCTLGFAFNETTTILRGKPNIEFFKMTEAAVNHATELGLKVSMPWGAHITVGRFANHVDTTKVQEVARLLRSKTFSEGLMPYVEVCTGHYQTEGLSFKIERIDRHQI
ncbi:MAG: hypothetical protein RI935_730 [Candidatus Parcubacteria bacterium]|jgi:hypothetical protein